MPLLATTLQKIVEPSLLYQRHFSHNVCYESGMTPLHMLFSSSTLNNVPVFICDQNKWLIPHCLLKSMNQA